eukprot:359057-Chlamydomonas_euryale.AAC.2
MPKTTLPDVALHTSAHTVRRGTAHFCPHCRTWHCTLLPTLSDVHTPAHTATPLHPATGRPHRAPHGHPAGLCQGPRPRGMVGQRPVVPRAAGRPAGQLQHGHGRACE